jgi:hypothetical protein
MTELRYIYRCAKNENALPVIGKLSLDLNKHHALDMYGAVGV